MIDRRSFLALLAASRLQAAEFPSRVAKVVKLFRSPDGHPNGLETASEGFWIGEQVTDRAHLVDWNGKLLHSIDTESSNTSGIAFGDGGVWMAANGPAVGRVPRATDAKTGEVVKADPQTGKTLARYPVPGGGGVHGLEFAENTLWLTSLKIRKLSQVDPKDFHVIHQIPVHLDRAHGLAWDPPGIWVMHSTDRVIHKLDAKDGHILEQITLSKDDPDPHGMCMYAGHLYYTDAGIAPGGMSNGSPSAGFVCRID
jgi:sugar lactone lactonase YvrE